MPLAYYPDLGEILFCDYRTGFVQPEMTKARPVVVISPRLRRRSELATVVPLSTTAPDPVEPHHCQIILAHPLPSPFDNPGKRAMRVGIGIIDDSPLKRYISERSRFAQASGLETV